MNHVAIAIFVITSVLVASRRLSWLPLDRPAVVLVGAVACVATGVLTPDAAMAAVDTDTVLLLFAVMGMGAFLAVDGAFDGLEHALAARARTPSGLLGWVVWPAGLASALLTNDAVALLGAPVVLRLTRRLRLPPLPYLLALACAANTGSVATLVGNPQNMLCASLGDLSYRDHLVALGPVAIAGLALTHAWIAWSFRARLGTSPLPPPGPAPSPSRGARLTTVVLAGVAGAYLLELSLPWTATAGFATLLVLHRRDSLDLWRHIDWPLLLFFCGLFVVVEGLVASGAPAAFFAAWPLASLAHPDGALLSTVFLVGSNLVSNVPFILLVAEPMRTLPHPTAAWELLAMASTFAGNLTLLGSVANIIVAEAARDEGGIGFGEHLRIGAPLALATTALGTAWIVLVVGPPG